LQEKLKGLDGKSMISKNAPDFGVTEKKLYKNGRKKMKSFIEEK